MTAPSVNSARFWSTTILGIALLLLLPLGAVALDSALSGGTLYSMIPLLVTNPLIFLVGTLVVSHRHGWWGLVTLAAYAATYLLSLVLIYNFSALVYLGFYIVLTAFGLLIAGLIRRAGMQ